MTTENAKGKEFKAKIFSKEYTIRFQVRNFIALKKRFGINMYNLINRVLDLDEEAIIYMIWCGTLEFNDFDLSDPVSIKSEIDLKPLFEMDGNKLRELSLSITKGLLASLPKSTDTKKKTPTAIKEVLTKLKTILKLK